MAEQKLPVISMQTIDHGDGTYSVSVLVSGLQSLRQADAAIAHLERLLCGQEIKERQ